jgi:hypothetical protein
MLEEEESFTEGSLSIIDELSSSLLSINEEESITEEISVSDDEESSITLELSTV